MNKTNWNTYLKHSILLLGCSYLLLSCTVSKSKISAPSPKTDSLYQQIKISALESMAKNKVPGVAIAVIIEGKIAWIQCLGLANVEEKKAITTQTIFNVGSISKLVSSWGFMQLTEKNIIDLDEPITAYLTRWKVPESSFDASKISLRKMLSHTAGLSVHGYGGSEQGQKLLSLEESLQGKTKRNGESVKLINDPGTTWKYSGGGYTLTQLLLEERTKQSFSTYMRENIFLPLGMRNSDFEWTPKMMKNSATAYDNTGKPIKNRIFTEKAAAGLQTTIIDLAHFAELSISADRKALHKVLKPETIRTMQQTIHPSSPDGESGLGYRFMNYEGFRTIGHTGENEGWNAALFLDIASQNGLVILTNGSNGDQVWHPIYQRWVRSFAH